MSELLVNTVPLSNPHFVPCIFVSSPHYLDNNYSKPEHVGSEARRGHALPPITAHLSRDYGRNLHIVARWRLRRWLWPRVVSQSVLVCLNSVGWRAQKRKMSCKWKIFRLRWSLFRDYCVCDSKVRDDVRRAYLQKGPFQPLNHNFPQIDMSGIMHA